VGTAALWLSLSGLLLLLRSFRRQDFDLIGAWRRRTPLRIVNGTSGDRAEVRIDSGRNLYLALEAAGIELPSNCGGGGSCGLCVVQFRSSAPMPVSEERSLLSQTALDAGMRLACRHYGRHSAEIEIADAALTSARRDMVITGERFLTPFMKELTLHPADGRPFSFRAGSYLQVDIPADPVSIGSLQIPRHFAAEWIHLMAGSSSRSETVVRRSYSMANAPAEVGNEIRLNVRAMPPFDQSREAPWGRGSSYLFSRRPGDRIQVRGPYGMFCDTGSTREKIFIGGGAGMAPLRSIIVDLLRNRASSARISYWYGARTSRELFYREDFEQLAREFRNFSWRVALSDMDREDEEGGLRGYIHQVVRDDYLHRHPDPRGCEYYLCGPPAMLAATRAMLTALGVPADQVFFDDFGI
jgi:Na(+)-translocating NADH:ubiquinone oxidoreductase F subunit